MSKEQGEGTAQITAIRIDLKDRAIIFESEGQPVAKLTLASSGVIYEGPANLPNPNPSADQTDETDTSARAEQKEKVLRSVLSGRLKAKPRPGQPDRSGNPTAFARFAAHVEGEDQAHDYIATFHRHTARIALELDKDAQITVDGYPHPSGSAARLDTFSVINLVNYPGKPPKRKQ